MSVSVDSASAKDLNRLYEIERACFEDESFTKRQIAQLLADYNTISLTARMGDRIVGFIIGSIYVEREALFSHILTIDVSPDHRRKGIGLMLLKQAERLLKEKGVKKCHLEVREDNLAALGLYRKMGYEIMGRLRNYYKNAHGLYLGKNLT